MGTSTSHPSPRNLNWKRVIPVYTSDRIPVERAATEIWRAATSDSEVDYTTHLASEGIFNIMTIADRASTAIEGLRDVTKYIVDSKNNSLFMDLAKRAMIKSIGSSDRQLAFGQALFSEVTNYLVSRDISGFVGSGRNKNITDSISLKSQIKNVASKVASQHHPGRIEDIKGWRGYVKKVIGKLNG